MKPSPSRTARIFLSSTFRDFGEERDLLVRRVFPALRARLKDRFVELVDVDLRWGITAEQAERGEVLPICLAEIDRSRPFFVGLLGERYGWVPEKGKYPPELVEQRPWLRKHQGGKSVTELEILHGVLNNPKMAGRALFYFRSGTYAKQKGGDYLPQSPEDRSRQKDLKARIRDSGFPVVSGYKDPEALAKRLEKDLWKILDEMYPADEVPDAFTREGFRHEAYAVPRRRLYLGGEGYIEALDAALGEGKQRILVEGASGGGKSALIANWLEKREKKHRKELVHVHYLGATAEASDPQALVRRLIEAIKRLTESTEEIASDPQALYDSLSTWLAIAHAYAAKRKTKVLIVLDALNGLRDLQDLRWFPEFLPERVRLVVSCLPGPVHEALLTKGDWQRIEVSPLDTAAARELFVAYLKRYNKELPKDLLTLALSHPLSTNPLFLRTLAEELRLFGVHEQLTDRLTHYLTSRTVDDLFERVLERVEGDCGAKQVRKAMEGIWASRAGLSEYEVQGFANLKPAEWASIRHALDDSLLESGGRITFAHDYMRLAVSDRYLAGNNTLQDEGQSQQAIKLRKKAHIALAKFAANQPAPLRALEETWQRRAAWDLLGLRRCLQDQFIVLQLLKQGQDQYLINLWSALVGSNLNQISSSYERAWARWRLPTLSASTAELAQKLQSFLSMCGLYSSFNRQLLDEAVKVTVTCRGRKHPDTASRFSDLGLFLHEIHEFEQALEAFQEALNILEGAEGSEDQVLAAVWNNRARSLQALGRYDEATEAFEKALVKFSANGAGRSMSFLICSNNLAMNLHDLGQLKKSHDYYKLAISGVQSILGPHASLLGVMKKNFACLMIDMQRFDEASILLKEALTIIEAAFGMNHIEVAFINSRIGILHFKCGRFVESLVCMERSYGIVSQLFVHDHPEVKQVLENLNVVRKKVFITNE